MANRVFVSEIEHSNIRIFDYNPTWCTFLPFKRYIFEKV